MWSTLFLALPAAGLLVPPASPHSRHTIAFGPHIASESSSIHSPSSALSSFYTTFDALSQEIPSGLDTAQAFLKHLHPAATFRLDSGYLSSHNGIYHAHFVQTVDDLDVSNALVSIHVDTLTNSILTYSDAAWKGKTSCPIDPNAHRQFVLATQPCVTSYDGPRDGPLVDPRLALLSLLKMGAPDLPAPQLTVDHVMDNVAVSHPLHQVQDEHGLAFHLQKVPGSVSPVPTKLAWMQDGEGDIVLTWRFEVPLNNNQYEGYVKATHDASLDGSEEPDIVAVLDWVKDFRNSNDVHQPVGAAAQAQNDETDDEPYVPVSSAKGKAPKAPSSATYRVFPWSTNDPTEGDRMNLEDPYDHTASPFGWHHVPPPKHATKELLQEDWHLQHGWSDKIHSHGVTFPDTRGNNVYAQANPSGGNQFELNHRPHADDLNFTYPLGWGCKFAKHGCEGKIIDPTSYLNASVTELFYTVNMMHDLSFRYGFDEAAGNFQERNADQTPGGGGVVAMAQDGSGMNNANFMTPPAGQRPRMRMYVWDGAEPFRDGDLEAGIVIHEFTHGISTRLTGGPQNSGCLGWGEAGGMGEGWGDWLATLIRMHKKKVRDWSMGQWAAGRGIRRYPYSTNITHNPQTYKTVNSMWEVHSIGGVWAEILFVLTENLIIEHGWEHDLFPPAPLTKDSPSEDYAAHEAFYNTSRITGKKYPAKGNTLAMQLVIDGMKLQPCRPDFLAARDAILAADQALTGGANHCNLFESFASRGLGPEAAIRGQTPFGGGFRTEDYDVPSACKKQKHHRNA